MKKVAFVIGAYPPAERERRERVALSFATPEVQVGIISTHVTPYIHNITPAEVQLVAPALMQAFREAEKQGYDAVVPLGFLDLGIEGGRSVVDIPVIGPMEASLHLAAMLGQRIGLITYHTLQFPITEVLVRSYGMEKWVVGIEASGYDLPDIAANHDAMVAGFVKSARKLIEVNRAEVIVPTGVSQCPIHIDPRWLAKELGVPVVEGIGAPIRLAAMFADLGLNHSRKRWAKSQSLA